MRWDCRYSDTKKKCRIAPVSYPPKSARRGFTAVRRREIYHCGIFSGRRILILDEPTSGLDGQNMRLIAERLKSEVRNGRTILVITHDRELIESCCDNFAGVEKRLS